MTATKRILRQSLVLLFYSTLFCVIGSIIFSVFFSASGSLSSIIDYFGNLALFGAMVLFIVGGSIDILHSAKWSAAMKMLKLRREEWTIQESHDAERRALVPIITGFFMFLEVLLLFFKSF